MSYFEDYVEDGLCCAGCGAFIDGGEGPQPPSGLSPTLSALTSAAGFLLGAVVVACVYGACELLARAGVVW